MYSYYSAFVRALERVPNDVIALLARIGIGGIFLRSGLLKLGGWADGTTLALFTDEYKLVLLPPQVSAFLVTAAELTLGPLILVGLATRLSAFALLMMTLVIEIFIYPNAFDTHAVWAVSLIFLLKYGPGSVSLDALAGRLLAAPR